MTTRLFTEVRTVAECAALFPKTTTAVAELAAAAKARALTALEAVYATAEPRTFQNTAVSIDLAAANLDASASILSVVKNTHTDSAVREEARKWMVDLDAFSIDHFSSNRKLYNALKSIDASTVPTARSEYQYWLENELKDYRRRGMDLPDETFAKVVALEKEISECTTQFNSNVAEDNTQVLIGLDGLTGVPAGIVSGLKKTEDGQSYILKMDYPTYFGVMKNCEVAATRKAMSDAFERRAFPKNEPVLRDVIFKRNQMASMLGYASFSDFDLDSKMARTPAIAQKFIDDLVPRLQIKWNQELAFLKQNLHSSVVLSDAGEIQYYDIAFCMEHAKKQLLNVDETTIQEYFPMNTTVKALFDIYEAFFDIVFESHEVGSELWHKDVTVLAVKDRQTKDLIGHIVLDLFPREGKYSHACCHSVVPPALTDDGKTFSPSLSVVLANFPAATETKPPLFLHSDVETFFHEFGHAIHGLMGRSHMATFAGTRVKRDFVELPSQMLEEWLWEPSILSKVTSHYETKETLPESLIKAKVASQNAFSGRDSLRQLQFATYSLSIFGNPFSTSAKTPEELDAANLFCGIQPRLIPGVQFSNDNHFECAFGHLMGYAATYYGYMWSEVFAQDVFDYIRSHDGLLSAEMGRRYVDCIIGVGGAEDPNDMLKKFLGREPNSDAFLKKLGV